MSDFLKRVWGNKQGYVFLPHKDGKRWIETPPLKWPAKTPEIDPDVDSYFCPILYSKPRRLKENALPSKWLFADLDFVDPRKIPLRPSIAWRTSQGRYQALWELKRSISPQHLEELNRDLTYATKADKGGWHLTKVLRLPESWNHKYSPAQQGSYLWIEDTTYTVKEIRSYTKTVESFHVDNEIHDLILPAESRESILKRILPRLDSRAREMIIETHTQSEGERSDRLWELECRLLEASIDPEEVFVIVRDTVWNKFKGRARADEYLWNEVSKAHLYIGSKIEVDETTGIQRTRPRLVSYSDILGSKLTEPEWLIEDWWTLNSHGIIAGLPKSYKSLVAFDMAVSIASGRPFLGEYEVNSKGMGPVLMVQQENSLPLVRDRLMKISKNRGLQTGQATVKRGNTVAVTFPPSLPLYFYNDFGFDMSIPDDREAIDTLVREEGIKALFFDPLYLMIGGADENNAKELRPILSWLLRLRNLYGCAIMVVHHWGKGNSDKKGRGAGGTKLLGSTTLYGWLEAALYLESKITDSNEIQVIVEREFRERLSPPPIGFTLNMGDIGNSDYSWSRQGAIGTTNRVLWAIEEAGEDGATQAQLRKATEMGEKKVRAQLASLLDGGQIRSETEGRVKRFYLGD